MVAKRDITLSPGVGLYAVCNASLDELRQASNFRGCACVVVRMVVYRQEFTGTLFNHVKVWWTPPVSRGLRGIGAALLVLEEMCLVHDDESGLFLLRPPVQEIIWGGHGNAIPYDLVQVRPQLHTLAHELLAERFEEIRLERLGKKK